MSKQRLHGSAAAVALLAAAGVTLAAAAGVALAQEETAPAARSTRVGAIPDARPLSEALTPAEIAKIRAAQAEAAAAESAAEAEAEEAEAAEAEAEAEEEETAPEPTLAQGRGPSLTGFTPGQVNQDPVRRWDLMLSQGLSFDTDAGLDGGGAIASATTNARLTYTAITPISSLNLSLSAGIRALGGDGSDRNLVPIPDLSVAWTRRLDPTTTFATSFSANLDQVAFTEPDALAITFDPTTGAFTLVEIEGDEGDAMRLALGAGMSLSHAVNARNQVSGGLSLSHTDYVDADSPVLSASTSGSTNLSWTHQSGPTLSHSLSGVVSVSSTDSVAEQKSLTVAVTGGANWAVNPRLSTQGSIGPSLTFSQRTIGGDTERFTSPGIRALAGLTYSGAKHQVVASFSNTVDPTSGGGIANRTALTLGGRMQLDPYSSVGANFAVGWQQPLSGDDGSAEDSLTVRTGVNFSTRLFEEVNATIGYGLGWTEDDDGSDVSHRVSLTFSRGFTFLP